MEYRVYHEDTVSHPNDDVGGCTQICKEEGEADSDYFKGTAVWGVWEEGVTSSLLISKIVNPN